MAMAFSGPQEFHVNIPANHTPTVTASDVSATKGQTISASSLFQASDADGDGLTYFFYDNSADPTSGHFTVNGVVQAAGTTFAVSAAQLAQTTFTAGSLNSDDLFVNVYDGMAFSGPQEFHVNIPANHTPTVTASDVSATKGQTISASSLFQASDADGDGLTYFFYDNSADPTSGHFTVNGVVQAARTTFAVSASQLAQTTFTAGSFNSDDLFVNVYDGAAFSGPQEFHVNVPANHAPTVTATDQTAPSGQVMSASSLFQASDADGDGLTYFFYDNSADPTSGHFTVNGVVQPAGTTFAVSAAQLAQTTFTVGTAGTEDLFVNVWDGLAFSGPQEFHIGVAPNHAPVITSNGGGATAAVNAAENTTAVTTVIASDADPLDSLSYTIAGGADAALFSINATTGVLSFVSAPNAESPQDAGGNNVYDVTVQVSDGAATDSQAIAVTVTDVNEFAPAITSNGGGATATANVAENTAAVTTVTASDADLSAVAVLFRLGRRRCGVVQHQLHHRRAALPHCSQCGESAGCRRQQRLRRDGPSLRRHQYGQPGDRRHRHRRQRTAGDHLQWRGSQRDRERGGKLHGRDRGDRRRPGCIRLAILLHLRGRRRGLVQHQSARPAR